MDCLTEPTIKIEAKFFTTEDGKHGVRMLFNGNPIGENTFDEVDDAIACAKYRIAIAKDYLERMLVEMKQQMNLV